MITSVISDTSITFFARGRPWTLASDHPAFDTIKSLLASNTDDEDELVRLTDVRVGVTEATEGRAVLTDDGLFLDGEQLSTSWEMKAASEPTAMKVLLVSAGDKVRVEGDEDAPDGIYVVGEVDNQDVDKRVYVESDEDFFGFVANTSIKEIIRD
jgi:hypothetical protein